MSRRIQWCPHCKERSLHEDGGRFENDNISSKGLERDAFLSSYYWDLLPEFPQIEGYCRYRKCLACDTVWTSIEAPRQFFVLIIQELEKIINERKELAAELEIARRKNETITGLLGRLNDVFQPEVRYTRFEDTEELQ